MPLSVSQPVRQCAKRTRAAMATTFASTADHIAADNRPHGIFGVPLRQSITYANVAISLVDEQGKSYIYGYVPIVVAKCGVFLKEKATAVEGIFRLSGSEKRIKELKQIFDSPDRYGKGLVWDNYTVHDAANVLRRYLNDLPEPVVPLDLYEKFRDPLRGATRHAAGDAEGPQFIENFDEMAAISKYQKLITELPPLNRQLLLYILDLLAVFAAKSEENRMNSQNLAAIFQPGMLSHPQHAMAPEEYRLNQHVLIFLIENQDHFLIGMQGTATDEKTKQLIEKGTPPPAGGPITPNPNRQSGLGRSASNASAGAESVRRDGMVRRNRSTSSRHSHHEGSSTPNSPALIPTPNSALGRSNTVPSKKSPALQGGRFRRDASPVPGSPREPAIPSTTEELAEGPDPSPSASTSSPAPAAIGTTSLAPSAAGNAGRSQERLLEPHEATTPARERTLPSIFQRSPTGEGEKRQPNKLKKKRIPGSLNPSAQSSAASLTGTHSAAVSPSFEAPNPMENMGASIPEYDTLPVGQQPTHGDTPSESTPRASQVPSNNTLHPEQTLKAKKSPPTSLHSSFNEGSDIDQTEESIMTTSVEAAEPDKDKKKRWRLSRQRKDEGYPYPNVTSPRLAFGSSDNADVSTTSIGSGGYRPRKSFTGESSEQGAFSAESHDSGKEREGKDESKGPIGWIRNKYREARESVEERRNKSPPADRQSSLGGSSIMSGRGKSLDIRREPEERTQNHPALPPTTVVQSPAAPVQTQYQAPTAVPPPPPPPVPQPQHIAHVQTQSTEQQPSQAQVAQPQAAPPPVPQAAQQPQEAQLEHPVEESR
ncbi:Rho-GTPase-activating protein 5 [Colletotrichum sidae]|uniref:Rho-GTPase-activating protein 5 n=1 Tax=Colletotrichum sidae TaxID=1347389 RepID=A0A4R8TIN2_9PEZI|nr:Rho-GTPase-activating protein 5 [Colletotrichum sidae]